MSEIKEVKVFDDKELEQAEAEAAQEEVVDYVHKFKKPLMYNGVEYAELHFNFDDLTGADSLEVEKEMQRTGQGVVIAGAFNSEYMIRIAARACQEPIGADAFKTMRLFDYNKIKDRVRNFLLRSEQ